MSLLGDKLLDAKSAGDLPRAPSHPRSGSFCCFPRDFGASAAVGTRVGAAIFVANIAYSAATRPTAALQLRISALKKACENKAHKMIAGV